MYDTKLSKPEIISRIVKERETYLQNALMAKETGDEITEQIYRNRAGTIEILMKVLDIKE